MRSYLLHFILVLLLTSLIGTKIIYHFLSSPPTYKPNGEITYTTPNSKIPPEIAVAVKEPSSHALLPGAKWVPQTFNNCGPATTSMVLQYFDFNVDQNITKAALRTSPDDTNVFTYEMANYLKEEYDISSKLLFNGNIELLKKLIANGFYVVVEDWLHPNEDIGHVTIIRGFDDTQGVLIADDSYIGVNITYKYTEFDQTQWKAFNREYLPVYKADQEALLKAIIGKDWDPKIMYQNAVLKAQEEIAQNSNDMYAYFNLGTSYFALNEFEKAKSAFEKSRTIGWPRRMLWYQIQPIQTYNKLKEYNKALELADIALRSNDSFAESHLEKAIAYSGLGDREKAREEANKALFYSPNFEEAKKFLSSI